MINSLLLPEVQDVLERLHSLADARDEALIQLVRGNEAVWNAATSAQKATMMQDALLPVSKDDDHECRGAELAIALRGDLFNLPDADFELLCYACAAHTEGLTEGDVTIQTCWDADRLDLGRVGMIPAPKKLCTPAARTWEMIQWADGRAAFEVVPDLVNEAWGIDLEER